jgi:hypothetical protein
MDMPPYHLFVQDKYKGAAPVRRLKSLARRLGVAFDA